MADLPAKNNPWFAISMGLVGVIVGYGLALGTGGISLPGTTADVADKPTAAQPTPPPPPPAGEVTPPSDTDHIRGDADAVITIIEYSDFECPFCSRHAPTVDQLVEDYDGKVNLVFRHFPLGFHANAQKAAEATECAADQGGNDSFWGFHDALFEKGVTPDSFADYATELGLDAGEFSDCLDSGEFEQKVKDDMAGGSKAGVRGTPGNVLYNNETKESQIVSGAQPLANFKSIIDGMLE
ncbi:DsbA family protein [Patescibacteria group bacterium]|nr:DsbA family protein [Patescibacteria group bacterium]MBU2259875.1 DsbA family protein [Patescibacteria group bacterium]